MSTLSKEVDCVIKRTVNIVRNCIILITTDMYNNLMSQHPEFKRFFNPAHHKPQLNGSTREDLGASFALPKAIGDSLVCISIHLGPISKMMQDPETEDLLHHIVAKHVAVQVSKELYFPMCTIFKFALENALTLTVKNTKDPGFEEEEIPIIVDAWVQLYWYFAGLLQGKEHRLQQTILNSPGGWAGAREFEIVRYHLSESYTPRHNPVPRGLLPPPELSNPIELDGGVLLRPREKNLDDRQHTTASPYQNFTIRGHRHGPPPEDPQERAEATSTSKWLQLTLRAVDNKPVYPAQPGSYLTLRIHHDGQDVMRHYHVINQCYEGDNFYCMVINIVPNGFVSQYLLNHCKVGTILHVHNPTCNFGFPEDFQDAYFKRVDQLIATLKAKHQNIPHFIPPNLFAYHINAMIPKPQSSVNFQHLKSENDEAKTSHQNPLSIPTNSNPLESTISNLPLTPSSVGQPVFFSSFREFHRHNNNNNNNNNNNLSNTTTNTNKTDTTNKTTVDQSENAITNTVVGNNNNNNNNTQTTPTSQQTTTQLAICKLNHNNSNLQHIQSSDSLLTPPTAATTTTLYNCTTNNNSNASIAEDDILSPLQSSSTVSFQKSSSAGGNNGLTVNTTGLNNNNTAVLNNNNNNNNNNNTKGKELVDYSLHSTRPQSPSFGQRPSMRLSVHGSPSNLGRGSLLSSTRGATSQFFTYLHEFLIARRHGIIFVPANAPAPPQELVDQLGMIVYTSPTTTNNSKGNHVVEEKQTKQEKELRRQKEIAANKACMARRRGTLLNSSSGGTHLKMVFIAQGASIGIILLMAQCLLEYQKKIEYLNSFNVTHDLPVFDVFILHFVRETRDYELSKECAALMNASLFFTVIPVFYQQHIITEFASPSLFFIQLIRWVTFGVSAQHIYAAGSYQFLQDLHYTLSESGVDTTSVHFQFANGPRQFLLPPGTKPIERVVAKPTSHRRGTVTPQLQKQQAAAKNVVAQPT